MELIYRLEPKAVGAKSLNAPTGGVVLFGGTEPVMEESFSVSLPARDTLLYEIQNGAMAPEITVREGRTTYSWTCRNCPCVRPQAHAVDVSYLVPRLVWTTYRGWEELGIAVSEPYWDGVDASVAAVDGFFQMSSPEMRGVPAVMYAASWVLAGIQTVDVRPDTEANASQPSAEDEEDEDEDV